MIKYLLSTSLFIVCVFNQSIAQKNQFGVSLGVGQSQINILSRVTEKQLPFSGSAGIFYERAINKRFDVGVKALYFMFNGLKSRSGFGAYIDENYKGIFFESSVNSSYLAFPAYVGFNFGRIELDLGVQPMVWLNGHHTFVESYVRTLSGSRKLMVRAYTNELPKFYYGALAALGYSLSEKAALKLSYFQGLKDFSSGLDFSASKSGFQVAIGLNYSIISK